MSKSIIVRLIELATRDGSEHLTLDRDSFEDGAERMGATVKRYFCVTTSDKLMYVMEDPFENINGDVDPIDLAYEKGFAAGRTDAINEANAGGK